MMTLLRWLFGLGMAFSAIALALEVSFRPHNEGAGTVLAAAEASALLAEMTQFLRHWAALMRPI